MRNSDNDLVLEDEPEMTTIDERLSKLSLIARNVTIRLSSGSPTKRGSISGKTPHNTNQREQHGDGIGNKTKVTNFEKINTMRKNDMCSCTVSRVNETTEEIEVVEMRTSCLEGADADEKGSNESNTTFFKCNSRTCPSKEPVTTDSASKDTTTQYENGKEHCASRCDGSLNSQSNNGRKFHELNTKNVSSEKAIKIENCSLPKHRTPSRKNAGQSSNVSPRVPIGAVRRKKSMKLGERSLARKKSFLKKGDGLAARRQHIKRRKTNNCCEEETTDSGMTDIGHTRKKMFLRMPRRLDDTNCSFLLLRNKKYQNKMLHCDRSMTGNSSSGSRRQWSENGVQVIYSNLK